MASGIAFASIVALIGAFILLISFNVVPADPASFHTLRRVAAGAGTAFLVEGE